MSPALHVEAAGPAMTIQDMGRTGTRALGLQRGGAVDHHALIEAAALLGQDARLAALEMAGQGGTFVAEGDLRIALTGADMQARADGTALVWPGCHRLHDGARLTIGGARAGVYGYLSLGGGIDAPFYLGSCATQPSVGLGAFVAAGDVLPAGDDPGGPVERTLAPRERFGGGEIRIVEGPQTPLFDAETRARFTAATFARDPRGNRQGARLTHGAEPFSTAAQLSILSDVIVPGDIQVTGDGTPFVLMPDCQTTGGYPRIATVVPDDLARVAQAPPGATLTFRFVDRDTARADYRAARKAERGLASRIRPIRRDPGDIPDLLAYQLVDGVTDGAGPEEHAP